MPAPDFTPLKTALAGKSSAEIRVLVLEALQRWRAGDGQTRFELQLHGHLGREIVEGLVATGALRDAPNNPQKEAFIDNGAVREPFMQPILETVWTLIRAGVLIPSGWGGSVTILVLVTVTDAGLKFLDNLNDHPLSPSFVARLRTRYSDLPEAVLVLLEDTRACLDAGLLRPAVVLLGVAFETAVEKVLDALEVKAIKPAVDFKKLEAGKRIDQLKKALDVLDLKSDERGAAVAVVDYANALRLRRNDASHTTPKFPFDDLEEIEELIVSAGRHLPTLWAISKASLKP